MLCSRVLFGTYLKEKQPAPWTLIANKRPGDPLALRLGTFLNETQPLSVLHSPPPAPVSEKPTSSDPVVLRIGSFLNGTTDERAERASLLSAGDAAGSP